MKTNRSVLTLLAACAALSVAIRAAVPPPEQLLPADTLAVLAVPDYSKVVAVQKTAPIYQLWGDESLRPFREKFMAKLTKEVLEPVERELGVKLKDYADLVQGQFVVALTQNGWAGTTNPLPALLLIIDSREKSDALQKSLGDIRKKITDAGKTLRTDKLRDVEFSTFVLPIENADAPKIELTFGQSGSLLIVGTSTKDIEKLLARQAGSGAAPLAELPAFDANAKLLFRDTLSWSWVHVSPAMEIALKVATEAAGTDRPGPKPEAVAAALGATSLKTLAAASRFTPEGATVELFLGAPEDQRRGLLKLIATEAKDSSVPAFVPADAITFNRWRLDLPKAWATLEGALNELTGGAIKAFFIAPINEAGKQKDPTFDLQKSFIGNLGDDLISYAKAPRGTGLEAMNNQPSLTLIGSPNADQVIQALRTLVAAVASNPMFGGNNIEFKEREFLGKKIYTIPLPALPTSAGGTPTERGLSITAAGGYVAIAVDAAILEEYLRSGDAKPKPLSETPGLADAAQKVGGTGTGLFGFQNDRESVRFVYELLRANGDVLNALFAGSPLAEKLPADQRADGLKAWLDFSLLPGFDKLERYFSFSVFAGKQIPEGYLLRAYTPNPPAGK